MRYYSPLKGPSSKKCSTCEAVEAMDTEGRGSFLSLHRLAELCLLRIQQCVASVKNKTSNLAGVAQWIERCPANQRIKPPKRYSNVFSILIFLGMLYTWIFLKGYLKNVPFKNEGSFFSHV